MPVKETNVVEVLKLPNSDAHIVRPCKQDVGIDSHASNRVKVATELSHMVISPNVPYVDLFIASTHDDIAMPSLLRLVGNGGVLRVSIELQAENF